MPKTSPTRWRGSRTSTIAFASPQRNPHRWATTTRGAMAWVRIMAPGTRVHPARPVTAAPVRRERQDARAARVDPAHRAVRAAPEARVARDRPRSRPARRSPRPRSRRRPARPADTSARSPRPQVPRRRPRAAHPRRPQRRPAARARRRAPRHRHLRRADRVEIRRRRRNSRTDLARRHRTGRALARPFLRPPKGASMSRLAPLHRQACARDGPREAHQGDANRTSRRPIARPFRQVPCRATASPYAPPALAALCAGGSPAAGPLRTPHRPRTCPLRRCDARSPG